MQTLAAQEVDCSVDLDSHEHRVLHYLTVRAKGRQRVADYDFEGFASRSSAVHCAEELSWALRRLCDIGMVEKVAGEGDLSLPLVQVLVTCGCKPQRGMYDKNLEPPPCPHKGHGELGRVFQADFETKEWEELTAEEVKDVSPSEKAGLVLDSVQGLTWSVDSSPGASPPTTEAQRAGGESAWKGEGVVAKPLRLGETPRAPRGASAAALAREFDSLVRRECFGRYTGSTNLAGLAKNIAAWKRNGTSVEDIRGAMRAFARQVSTEQTKYRAPLWKVFCSRIDALVATHQRGTGSDRGESIRHDERAWL